MGITALFDTPLFTGGGISSLVPDVWPVAINGRPYAIDTLPETFYVRWNTETIPKLRQQADQSNAPAESSLNPQGLWRRAQDSWHHGAGQVYRDRDAQADPYRFRSSKGVDVWTRYRIGLLNDTVQKKASANTNLYAVAAGARIYMADGTALRYSTDLALGSAVTGYTGTSITSITSDGFNVYWTDGADIWTTNTGTAVATSADTTNATLLRYVKGRLMVAVGNILSNIPVLGSLPTMTYTHPNSGFVWVDICEGQNVIYAAGYAGDKSTIYRTAIKADGTALDVPVAAAPSLPDGEIVRSIQGYLGFVWIGTDKGVRFCEADTTGNLTIGPLIQTGAAVQAFEGQDRFMWFGWTNYDAASTGLGRMDITQFVNTDQPAYASDLMVTGSGAVSSIATFTNLRVFTIQGLGLYAETATLVTSGTIDMGCATFGLPDPKTAVSVDVQADLSVAHGSYQVWLQTDADGFVEIGQNLAIARSSETYPANQSIGEHFEVRLILTRATTTTGPVLTRWTLKVNPSTSDGPAEIFHVPLMLYPSVTLGGQDYPVDVALERREISQLRSSSSIITYQEFNETYTGFISDFKWFPYGLTKQPDGSAGAKGTMLVDIQRIS